MENSKRREYPHARIQANVLCPDFAVSLETINKRLQQNPGDLHLDYVQEHSEVFRNTKGHVYLFTDGDLNECSGDYVFILEWRFVLIGGVAKQSIFVIIIAEAEYIAAFDASKEALHVYGVNKGARHFRANVSLPSQELLNLDDLKLEKFTQDGHLS
ncbi:hypothetical protein Tco_0379323 [Tanacetum coccineum]